MTKRKYLKLWISIAFIVLLIAAVVGCAPRQANTEESGSAADGVAATITAEWTIDSDCKSCHVVEAQSATDVSYTYSVHATDVSNCTSCHTDDDGSLASGHKSYATAKQPTKLKKTTVTNDTCLSCHTQEELAQATAGFTELADSNNNTVNPHELPDTESHQKNVNCSNCHKMHVADNNTIDTAKKACQSCHHAGVFECGTCHE
jgi:hypothetical protein